jgi:hypothetical protein
MIRLLKVEGSAHQNLVGSWSKREDGRRKRLIKLVNKLLRVLQPLSALSIVGQLPSWSGEEVEFQPVGSNIGRIFAKKETDCSKSSGKNEKRKRRFCFS